MISNELMNDARNNHQFFCWFLSVLAEVFSGKWAGECE